MTEYEPNRELQFYEYESTDEGLDDQSFFDAGEQEDGRRISAEFIMQRMMRVE